MENGDVIDVSHELHRGYLRHDTSVPSRIWICKTIEELNEIDSYAQDKDPWLNLFDHDCLDDAIVDEPIEHSMPTHETIEAKYPQSESATMETDTAIDSFSPVSDEASLNNNYTYNQYLAELELLAQEFYRIMIPHQPACRLLKRYSSNTTYILSEYVKEFSMLPMNYRELSINGTYTGLGEILVISMFLQEIDLKSGNIGVDYANRFIKLDSGWCFNRLSENQHFYGVVAG